MRSEANPKWSDPPVRDALASAARRVSDLWIKKEGTFDTIIVFRMD